MDESLQGQIESAAGEAGAALEGAAAQAEAAAGEALDAAHDAAAGHHDGVPTHGFKHVEHPPEPPTFIQLWVYSMKKDVADKPREEFTATEKLAENLYYGPLDHKMPIINYAPWDAHLFLLIAAAVTVGLGHLFGKQFRSAKASAMRRPDRGQVFLEMVVGGMYKFTEGILGKKHAKEYFPFVGTLFVFIFVCNFLGLVPLMKPPTASLVITFSIALCTFFYVQYTAAFKMGYGKYLHHLAGEPSFSNPISLVLAPLFFVLETIGTLSKPVSLALRLFGNMLGKDILLGAFLGMGITLMSVVSHTLGEYVGVPLTFPFYFLGILLGAIQALVFTILSAIYILLVLPHEHHDDHGHGHDGQGHGTHAAAH
ncbi:MAG: F0F1 ATP synthase subunit A [Candidatus Sumerlaeia bacterium]|nr:F0F1 ATP synthase subunit A [Candidatus Sumerlaeia bacterium]